MLIFFLKRWVYQARQTYSYIKGKKPKPKQKQNNIERIFLWEKKNSSFCRAGWGEVGGEMDK